MLESQSPGYIIESPEEGNRLENQSGHKNYSLELELPATKIQFPAGSKILDAGCGTGLLTRYLWQNNFHRKLTIDGVDGSADRINQAKELLGLNGITTSTINFWQAPLDKLPFGDNSYDHLFVRYVFQHLPDPHKVTQELYRVLKPGGTATVIDADGVLFNLETDHPALKEMLTKLAMTNAKMKLFSPYSCKKLPSVLRKVGFSELTYQSEAMIFDSKEDRQFEAGMWRDRLLQAKPLIAAILGENSYQEFCSLYLNEIIKGEYLLYYTKFIIRASK